MNGPDNAVNVLGPDMVPRHAEVSASYGVLHRRLELGGLLDHPFGELDRRSVWPVRSRPRLLSR